MDHQATVSRLWVALPVLALLAVMGTIHYFDLLGRIATLFILGAIVFLLPAGCLWYFYHRLGEDKMFSAFVLSLLFLYLVVALGTVIILQLPSNNLPKLLSVGKPLDALTVIGTVLTLWAAGSTSLLLLYQLSQEASADQLARDLAKNETLVAKAASLERSIEALDGSVYRHIIESERRVVDLFDRLGVQRVSSEEALSELKSWVDQAKIKSVFFFGSFSIIPGIWENMVPQSYNVLHECVARPGPTTFHLTGPDEESFKALCDYVVSREVLEKRKRMKDWSETVAVLETPGGKTKLWNRCKKFIDLIENAGGVITRLQEPWSLSSITFATAKDSSGVPQSCLFFGSPIAGDGYLPGEIDNIFVKPEVFRSKSKEIGSLLVHLEFLLTATTDKPLGGQSE